MTPLKFRAWHKEEKKMYYSEIHDEWGTSFNIYDWEGSSLWELEKTYVNDESPIGAVVVSSKNGVLMQSTGLKDKNEKEIYEGDLILFPKEEGGHTVVFEEGGFMAISSWGKTFEDKQKVRANWWRKGGFGMPEIIGNIYQNPELLK